MYLNNICFCCCGRQAYYPAEHFHDFRLSAVKIRVPPKRSYGIQRLLKAPSGSTNRSSLSKQQRRTLPSTKPVAALLLLLCSNLLGWLSEAMFQINYEKRGVERGTGQDTQLQ